jgi:hypothetical protein
MLLSMFSYALGVSLVDLFWFVRVFALDLVNILNFQLVSHVAQKVFDLESESFTGMLLSMCSCVPGYFYVDMFSIFRVLALNFVNIYDFRLVLHLTQQVFDLVS